MEASTPVAWRPRPQPADTAAGPDHGLAVYRQLAGYQAWLAGRAEEAMAAFRDAGVLTWSGGALASGIASSLACAALHAERGEFRAALVLLAAARREAAASASPCLTFGAAMLGAAIAQQRGHTGFCLAYLRPALALGARHGCTGVPWLRPAALTALLQLARAYQIAPEFTASLDPAVAAAAAMPGARPCRVSSLGRIEIQPPGQTVCYSRKAAKKPLSLLLHLIAAGPGGAAHESLIEALWPDTGSDLGQPRLKTTINRLRTLLGTEAAVQVEYGRVRLDERHCRIDAWQLERLASDRRAVALSGDALLALYRGRFFAGFFDERELLAYQVRLHHHFLRLAARAGQQLRERGEHAGALALFSEALSIDPCNELLCEEVLVSLADCGRAGEIALVFGDFSRRLRAELDTDPGARLQRRSSELLHG